MLAYKGEQPHPTPIHISRHLPPSTQPTHRLADDVLGFQDVFLAVKRVCPVQGAFGQQGGCLTFAEEAEDRSGGDLCRNEDSQPKVEWRRQPS